MMDQYNLTQLSPKDLDVFVASRYINEATRARLARLIDLRMSINQINARLAAFAAEIEAIAQDQERFRQNIESLVKTPEAKTLIARRVAKADEQESRLEQIRREKAALIGEKDRLERELATEIKNLQIS